MERDQFTKSGCMTIAIVFLGLFLAGGIYVFVGILNYMHGERAGTTNYYCNEAQIPAFASCVEDYEIVDFRDSRLKCFESKKYKNEQALIDQLPDGFSTGVNYAVTQGESESAKDIDKKDVTRYYVPETLIPLDMSCKTSNVERYYCVLKYPDGSCRFAIFVGITDPDN